MADINMNKKEEAQSGDKADFVKQMQATEPGPDEESPAGEDSKEVTSKETVAEERTEKLRVKKQRWTPETGFRRCALKFPGCADKCAEQGIEDCQNCHLNKTKEKEQQCLS